MTDFSYYRERVLAKTDGANVHRVNGLLGIVLNTESSLTYWADKPNRDEQPLDLMRRGMEAAEVEIRQLTGVSR